MADFIYDLFRPEFSLTTETAALVYQGFVLAKDAAVLR
ncbi:hypothetical protein FBY13_101491 [Pantoea sp. SJZ147]|nr:hypothetical protein FBY13_101491 [Pantoea sp. SJZ147]